MQPFYYRFVLRPSDGEVELAHNWESPADVVRYHSDLAAEQNEDGLYNGFAYRIKGGWRLTDWEHRPIDDPFVVAQVMRAIREQEGAHLPHDPQTAWEDAELASDKWHYGLPMSQNGTGDTSNPQEEPPPTRT